MKFLAKLFFESKLVRIGGMLLIFYFGIYKHDKSPDAVSKRFNKETLSKDFSDAKKQTKKIFTAISYKRSITVDKKSDRVLRAGSEASSSKQRIAILKEQVSQIDSLEQKVLTETDSETEGTKEPVGCSDFVTFSYDLIDSENEDVLFTKNNRSVMIAEQESILFERLLVGFFKNEVREIEIDKDHNFLPSIVRKYFLSSKKGILIKLKLTEINRAEIKKNETLNAIEKLICK